MIEFVRIPPALRGAGRAAGLALFFGATVAMASTDLRSDREVADHSVACTDGHISVRGDDVPIMRILEALAQACGVAINMHAPIDERASFRIENLPTERALKRILDQHSFLFVADRGSRGSRLLVLGEGTAGSATARIIRPGVADYDADRQEQIYRLGEGGSGRVTDELRVALDDPDRDVREAAIEALIEIGGQEAARAVALALDDPDIDVREAAVDALGHIGGTTSIRLLRRLVTDAHPVIREAAEDGLVELGTAL